MQAKEYLESVRQMGVKVNRQIEYIEVLESRAEKVTNNVTDVKVQTSKQNYQELNYIELIRAREKLKEMVSIMLEEHNKLHTMFDKITPYKYAYVLIYRYLLNLHCSEIADKMDRSESYTRALLRQGINKFKVIYNAELEEVTNK